ncbi:MAG: CHAT domain-containing protein [Rhodospirillales bacterium]|nr:CHAT domain-containing protein [Rhodospirillales bacterium]
MLSLGAATGAGLSRADYNTVVANFQKAEALRREQRYDEAEPLYERNLEIVERSLGPNHLSTANEANNLANLYSDQYRFDEADRLYKRALAIREKIRGPHHPDVADVLNNLAILYSSNDRIDDSFGLYKRALAIQERNLGPNHPDLAITVGNLGLLYEFEARYAEAEPLLKRALKITEKNYGSNHTYVADSLSNLALVYEAQARHADAEPLYKRTLAIRERNLDPSHPLMAEILNNLAILYDNQRRYEKAEPLYKRALAIWEKSGSPNISAGLNNLAVLYRAVGRYAEAEPLMKRSMAIREKTVGPGHPNVAVGYVNLAEVYGSLGRYSEAEKLMKRSIAVLEKKNRNHPVMAESLNSLAMIYFAQGRFADALAISRRAVAIQRRRAVTIRAQRSGGGTSENKKNRKVYVDHLKILFGALSKELASASEVISEGFAVSQLANINDTSSAVARMGARFAAGSDALAGLVRERQDLSEQWKSVERKQIDAWGKSAKDRDKDEDAKLQDQQAAASSRLKVLDARLSKEFPAYGELVAPQPVQGSVVHGLLADDEALMVYAVADDMTFLSVLRHDRSVMHQLVIGREELSDTVAALRMSLNPETQKNIQPFDAAKAYALYQKIFQPAENILDGARHIFTVLDGALLSLPLGVLVSAQPNGKLRDFSDYRQVEWLAKKYAMTTLPSVSSLRALRQFAKLSKATKPFLGIGDPQLDGKTGSERGVKIVSLFSNSGVANVLTVKQLPSLPDTADELKSLARLLGADENALIMGREATETRIKDTRLEDHKVLAFATHGLVAGDLEGLSEPALVLTPPAKGTKRDDGLLTASEVAQLKLDADWTILSACNTASADGTPDAEALSGLAKAFFYAGSRALLVSHWPVVSDAAVKITTGMLKEAQSPNVGRAEAHRRAILAMLDQTDKPHFAHPLFWAPFVVVGEGGRPPGS